jgi:methyltransferase-like protein
MAYSLPESRFTGIDLAADPIASGLNTVAALGLENITLLAADLMDIGKDYAGFNDVEFDYIIAHGFYSWVPPEVRDRLIALCHEWLAPQGIAFISYNVYPGRHVREMLREMMLYHTRNLEDPGERHRQAKWFLDFLRNGRSIPKPWRELMDHEMQALVDRPPGSLFHDDLAEINDPVYFRDFAAHAGRHHLQYLGDADVHEMFDPADTLAWLHQDDVLEREQYHDFLHFRTFRQTLLCHQGVQLDRQLTPARMEGLLFSASATYVDGGQIEGLRHRRIRAVHESVNRVVDALGETYPLPLSFEELIPYAGDREALRDILFGLTIGGFADIHVHDFPCEETVTAKPKASRLARHQASLSPFVTSACQHPVKLDEVGRRLVCLLDGTRDHQQLAEALAEMPGGTATELSSNLEWLARMALLEG